MQLLVITLDDGKDFFRTISKLKDEDMNGIVFPTTSLKHALLSNNVDAVPAFGFLSKIVEHDFKESHTMLILIKESKLERAKEIVRETTKGLGHKGIMFTLPVSSWEGLDE